MVLQLRGVRVGALGFMLAALTACGGGGGGSASGELLPTLSQDIEPAGARIDVGGRNLFPVHATDVAFYDRLESGVVNTATRSITSGPDAQGRFAESFTDSGGTDVTRYRTTTAGLEVQDPFDAEVDIPGLFAALPSYVEYVTPLFPVGGERKTIRQGNAGADFDGDGKSDFFRAEITQTFRGFEARTVLGRTMDVAHFTNRISLRVVVTSDGSGVTVTGVEEAYFASDIGLVHAERSATSSNGQPVFSPYSIELANATIDGEHFDVNGRSRRVPLQNGALIFDAVRNVYYASTTTPEAAGDRIATINATSGALSYSTPLGSSVTALAIAADGSMLYAGLLETGQVARIALPAMTEVDRIALPVDPTYGQTTATHIAASPTEAQVFAVSLRRPVVSPSHAGVVLVRGAEIQPVRTPVGVGSNRIAFGADGWLYGFNRETSEFGLRRMEVLPDGVAERQVVSTDGFGDSFDVGGGQVLVGNRVYRADATLGLTGTIANSSDHCAVLRTPDRIACRSQLGLSILNVANATTLAVISSPTYTQAASTSGWELVPGLPGQVAVREGDSVTLFSGPGVQ